MVKKESLITKYIQSYNDVILQKNVYKGEEIEVSEARYNQLKRQNKVE